LVWAVLWVWFIDAFLFALHRSAYCFDLSLILYTFCYICWIHMAFVLNFLLQIDLRFSYVLDRHPRRKQLWYP
jgi:hypothetical protein